MKHATKLKGPKNVFETDEFAEIFSPLVGPAEEHVPIVTGPIQYVELGVAY